MADPETKLDPRNNPKLGQMLAEAASVMIWISDMSRGCVYFNKSWLSFRGRTVEEEFGFRWAEGVHPDDYDRCLEIYETSFDAQKPFSMDYRLLRFDQQYRWIRDDGAPYFDEEGQLQGYIGTCFDITELVESRKAIAESEQRFQLLVNAIDEVFWMSDPGVSRMIYLSPGFEKLWGIPVSDLYQSPTLFINSVNPEDREAYQQVLEKYHAKGQAYECDYRIVADGKVRWIHERGYPVRNEEGEVVYMAGISTDISEQKALNERMRQTEKIEAVGQLAGGMAHDFNNQLTGILGYADLLKHHLQDHKLEKYADRIITAATRAAAHNEQLLTFSRKGRFQPKPVDLHQIISETVDMLYHSIDKLVALRQDLNADEHMIMGDSSQIQNALLNLGLNARDAMPNGGVLTYSTDRVFLDTSFIVSQACKIKEGQYIVVYVTDTGSGIPDEVKDHLFEPFFTTKEEGKGTGLGLASVYGTIKRHHGCIVVDSEVGQGACFKIYLPLHLLGRDQENNGNTRNAAEATKVSHSLTVLIVDDEEMVRNFLEDALANVGYTVLTAADGQQAIACYKESWQTIDLIILDMIMPNIDGLQVFQAMKAINPQLQAIISSGYSLTEKSQEVMEEGAIAYMQKPFKINQLLQVIEETMTDQ